MTRIKKKTAPFYLGEHDIVLHAWAEPCSGSGWSNAPIKVLILDGDKSVRIEYLQPSDQTRDMAMLYSTSSASHEAMTGAVVNEVATWKRGKE